MKIRDVPGMDWLIAACGIAMITYMVLPGRQSARIIEGMSQSYAGVIRAAVGAVEGRNPDSGVMLRAMPADARDTVLDMLSPADRHWVEVQMRLAEPAES